MQAAIEDTLYAAKVDLVFSGHVHAYERSCRVYKYACVADAPYYITIGEVLFPSIFLVMSIYWVFRRWRQCGRSGHWLGEPAAGLVEVPSGELRSRRAHCCEQHSHIVGMASEFGSYSPWYVVQ